MTDDKALLAECAEVLRETQTLVAMCCPSGFTDETAVRKMYENNGEIDALLAKLPKPEPEIDEATIVLKDVVLQLCIPAPAADDFADAAAVIRKALAKRKPDVPEDQIKQIVDRFLSWRLPDDFHPDAGISFEPEFNKEYNAKQGKPPQRHTPTGTILFSAAQADAMVRYILGDRT